jgi:hypothetical protein
MSYVFHGWQMLRSVRALPAASPATRLVLLA